MFSLKTDQVERGMKGKRWGEFVLKTLSKVVQGFLETAAGLNGADQGPTILHPLRACQVGSVKVINSGQFSSRQFNSGQFSSGQAGQVSSGQVSNRAERRKRTSMAPSSATRSHEKSRVETEGD